jgi:fumarate reductase flavoprotein subunit
MRSMELGPRDRISQAFVHEQEKGNTVDTPYGPVVYLDLRHLGEKMIDAKLPFVRELCQQYERIDPVHELIPVRPVQHYMMGGVHTDIDGATGLPGLFAAGEVACVSINGANRLGSNSLPECLVFGRRAGIAAADYAAAHEGGRSVEAQVADERRRLEHDLLARRNGRERIADVRTDMQHTMEGSVGIFRDTESLVTGVERLQELRERFDKATLEDTSRTFNTELVAALELGFMLDVAETMVASALRREESRGAHQRTDFPRRDDTRFLAHSLVTRGPGGVPHVDYLPVTITRWPPGERVYGR